MSEHHEDVHDRLGTDAFWALLRTDPQALAREVCAIHLVDLERTLERHPGIRGWVNAAYETSRIAEERAKWSLTKTRARVLLAVQQEAEQTGKRLTVATAEAMTDGHEDVSAAMDAYLDAGQIRAGLRAMADALEDRKDMLIQLSAKQRKEAEDYR